MAVEPVHQPSASPVPTRPTSTEPAAAEPHRPSPHDLAELAGAFAMTANVHDPEPVEAEPPVAVAARIEPPAHVPPDGSAGTPQQVLSDDHQHTQQQHHDDVVSERGLRGLVGGGASQVSVTAALRARDAARPTEADLAAAERDLPIVRRGWVPREELTRPPRR